MVAGNRLQTYKFKYIIKLKQLKGKNMFRHFMTFLAIFFPWVVLFAKDNPGGGLICIALQASVIGWLPASIWAFKVIHEDEKEKEREKYRQYSKPLE
jgi:uncharacterized membrane protein YqaE (UPF0057 family)